MGNKFSVYSIILIVVGIFIAYMLFPPLNIDFLGIWGVFIGFAIYLIGVVLCLTAFFKKEKGFVKYIALLSISLGVVYLSFLYAIVGKI